MLNEKKNQKHTQAARRTRNGARFVPRCSLSCLTETHTHTRTHSRKGRESAREGERERERQKTKRKELPHEKITQAEHKETAAAWCPQRLTPLLFAWSPLHFFSFLFFCVCVCVCVLSPPPPPPPRIRDEHAFSLTPHHLKAARHLSVCLFVCVCVCVCVCVAFLRQLAGELERRARGGGSDDRRKVDSSTPH